MSRWTLIPPPIRTTARRRRPAQTHSKPSFGALLPAPLTSRREALHPRLGVGFSPGDEAANRAFGLWDTETFDSNGLDRTSESRGAANRKSHNHRKCSRAFVGCSAAGLIPSLPRNRVGSIPDSGRRGCVGSLYTCGISSWSQHCLSARHR